MSFGARFIPTILGSFELVVLLTGIRTIITRLPKVGWKRFNLVWNQGVPPHVLRANCRLIHTSDNATSTRGTDTGRGKCMRVTRALGSELIDMRSDRTRISIATEMRINILRAQPQNIGTLGTVANRSDEKRKVKNQGR